MNEYRPSFKLYYLHPKFWWLWLALGLAWLFIQLPYSWLMQSGRAIGYLFYVFAKRRRHIAETNIKLCFPQMSVKKQQALVKASFLSAGCALLESPMVWWWSTKRLKKWIHVEGEANLLQHVEKDKGLLILTCHCNAAEMAGVAVVTRVTADGFYLKHKNPVFEYIQKKGRGSNNPETELILSSDVKHLINNLRRGRAAMYAPDLDHGRYQSVFAPFFNVPAATMVSTSGIVESGNAIIIPVIQTRLENAKGYRIQFLPALKDFPTDADIKEATYLNRHVENIIKQQPDQYMWVHRRFKTRPKGEKSFYD